MSVCAGAPSHAQGSYLAACTIPIGISRNEPSVKRGTPIGTSWNRHRSSAQYADVSTFYNYWLPSLVVDDETLNAAMESADFKKLTKSGMNNMDALEKLLPEYVVRGPIGSPRVWPKS